MKQRNDARARTLLAQECAKIILDEGVKDYRIAKKKALDRLNLENKSPLPSNVEIEQALIDHQKLFKSTETETQIQRLRRAAVDVMAFLKPYQPHLVGPVLKGIVSPHQEIHLHIYANTSEEVMLFLMEHDIPFEVAERRYKSSQNDYSYHPVITFTAEEINYDLTIFTHQRVHDAPRSPVDGKPMQRGNYKQVKRLLENS